MSKHFKGGLFAAVVVAAILAAGPVRAHDVRPVANASLPFQSGLDDEDRITLIRGPGTRGKVTICLAAGPNVTWWKTLEVFAGPERRLGKLVIKDNNKGPNCLSYDTTEFAPKHARFELRKAKAFGAPSGGSIKRFSPWAYDGKSFTIRWDKD